MKGVTGVARVILPSMLRDVTGGAEEVQIAGGTLGAVLDALVLKYPDIKARLFDESGSVYHYVAFFVDGVEVRASQGGYATVRPDSEIVIVPALSGGR